VGAEILLLAAMACHLAAVAAWPLRVYQTWQTGALWHRALRQHMGSGVAALGAGLVLLALTPVQTTTSTSLQIAGADPIGALVGSFRMLCWMAARLVTTAHWLAVDLGRMRTAELSLGAVTILGLAGLAWRHRGSAGAWAAWTLLYLAPFALISEQLATRGREGPSHYLYLASAGASVLLAMGIFALGRRLEDRFRGRGWIVTVACVLAITVSAVSAIWRLQPLSLYNTGRYLFDRDPATSVQYLRRAIDGGGGVVERHEAYLRLVLALPLAGKDPYGVLQEAARVYPTSAYVQGMIAVREMESADPAARARGVQRLSRAAALARDLGQQSSFGTNIAALGHNLGIAAERAGAPERAIAIYRRALEMNPHPEGTRARLGNAFRQLANQLADRGDSAAAVTARDSARRYSKGAQSLAF
jgi:tetratricopeptide (TPR) repeat protein